MEIKKLLKSDGSWDQFETDWQQQCNHISADYDDYAQYSLSPIRDFAIHENKNEWAYAVQIDHNFTAAFMIILASQKGLAGKTLRVRHMIACPLLDCGALNREIYVQTLAGLLLGAVKLSETINNVKNIKMHGRSPLDLEYLKILGLALDSNDAFKSSELQGSWLTLTKS